jgi:protoheme IX farnesyltransferase
MIRQYYELTKPGIVYGNMLVAVAGFLYASAGSIVWPLLTCTLVGLACVIASACVFNNYYDRDIDKRMMRTSKRALAAGTMSGSNALLYATVLGLAGGLVLFFLTSMVSFAVALAGWVVYVLLYTPLKHRSAHALWVGAIAGATPPVVGYAAVTNVLDGAALTFFIFLFLWQVPHFLGIAAYRFDEYQEAGIPLLFKKRPSERGKRIGRVVFYASLAVLLVWCGALMLHR